MTTTLSSDLWQPDSAVVRDAAAFLAEQVAPGIRSEAFCDDEVESHSSHGLELYSGVYTLDHTDEGYPEWTALVVLRNGDNVIRTGIDDADDPDSGDEVHPAVGDIVLFNLHRTHALELSNELMDADAHGREWETHLAWLRENHLFVAAHLDFDLALPPGHLPPREHVERLLESMLAPVLTSGTSLRP